MDFASDFKNSRPGKKNVRALLIRSKQQFRIQNRMQNSVFGNSGQNVLVHYPSLGCILEFVEKSG